MQADDVYLRAAIEWSRVTAALRDAAPGDDVLGPILALPRELAWCHVLAATGHHAAAMNRLRTVLSDLGGTEPPADAVAALGRLRVAVQARLPAAPDRGAA